MFLQAMSGNQFSAMARQKTMILEIKIAEGEGVCKNLMRCWSITTTPFGVSALIEGLQANVEGFLLAQKTSEETEPKGQKSRSCKSTGVGEDKTATGNHGDKTGCQPGNRAVGGNREDATLAENRRSRVAKPWTKKGGSTKLAKGNNRLRTRRG